MFTMKSNDLKSTHEFTWFVIESGMTIDFWLPSLFMKVAHFVWNPCMQPVKELDSLEQARMNF